MKTMLELFSGSGIMAETFKENGFITVTIDNAFSSDYNIDIRDYFKCFGYRGQIDIIWASPPCQCFSVASISTHWKGGKGAYIPKTDKCEEALQLLRKTISIILHEKPRYWFIENPRGVMRKVIDKIFKKYGISDYQRYTVTYCQYGDFRMKPTDIWTNCKNWKPRSMCKNGDSCHVSAPRGSKTGTQGLKNAYERGKLPKELCEEIVKACKD